MCRCKYDTANTNTCHAMWLVRVVLFKDCPVSLIVIFTLPLKKKAIFCTKVLATDPFSSTFMNCWLLSEIPPTRTWWRHQMETFSALLAICAGNSPVPGEFPTQRPVMRSFDVYFDLSPNKRLSKQLWGWWFETQSRPLWRHRNEKTNPLVSPVKPASMT